MNRHPVRVVTTCYCRRTRKFFSSGLQESKVVRRSDRSTGREPELRQQGPGTTGGKPGAGAHRPGAPGDVRQQAHWPRSSCRQGGPFPGAPVSAPATGFSTGWRAPAKTRERLQVFVLPHLGPEHLADREPGFPPARQPLYHDDWIKKLFSRSSEETGPGFPQRQVGNAGTRGDQANPQPAPDRARWQQRRYSSRPRATWPPTRHRPQVNRHEGDL